LSTLGTKADGHGNVSMTSSQVSSKHHLKYISLWSWPETWTWTLSGKVHGSWHGNPDAEASQVAGHHVQLSITFLLIWETSWPRLSQKNLVIF